MQRNLPLEIITRIWCLLQVYRIGACWDGAVVSLPFFCVCLHSIDGVELDGKMFDVSILASDDLPSWSVNVQRLSLRTTAGGYDKW